MLKLKNILLYGLYVFALVVGMTVSISNDTDSAPADDMTQTSADIVEEVTNATQAFTTIYE